MLGNTALGASSPANPACENVANMDVILIKSDDKSGQYYSTDSDSP